MHLTEEKGKIRKPSKKRGKRKVLTWELKSVENKEGRRGDPIFEGILLLNPEQRRPQPGLERGL
jgi:hypothetical protein